LKSEKLICYVILRRSIYFIMSKRLLLFCFVLFCFAASAQVNDAGLWASVSVEKKVSKRMDVSLSQEFRMNENISELGTAFTEVALEIKIRHVKGLSISPGYRFIQNRNQDNTYSLRHRLLADLNYRYKTGQFSFSLRERFQSQVADVMTGEDGFTPVHYMRSKLAVKFSPSKKKYSPWISAEAFYQLNNAEGNEIDNLRYAAGIDYDITKRHAISLFYLINQEVNVSNASTGYIAGIAYSYTLPDAHRKKKDPVPPEQ
jgi:hypothetical protein